MANVTYVRADSSGADVERVAVALRHPVTVKLEELPEAKEHRPLERERQRELSGVCRTHLRHLMSSSSSNCGRRRRFMDELRRFMFMSGRKSRISPFGPTYAFMPSKHYTHSVEETTPVIRVVLTT